MPRPRQARLPLDDSSAARLANYRVLRRAFLSATALSSYATCNVRPFIERVTAALGVQSETPEMRAGTLAHERVQEALLAGAEPSTLTLAQALDRGAFLVEVERPLKDGRRMLRGVADVVFAHDGQAHIVELKNTWPPPRADPAWGANLWFEHGLQLAFYGLLARRELGRATRLGLAYLRDAPKQAVLARLASGTDAPAALHDLYASSVHLEPGPRTEALVNQTIREFRRAERRTQLPPRNHDDPDRCGRCWVRAWCPERLDAPGQFEPLDATLLDGAR